MNIPLVVEYLLTHSTEDLMLDHGVRIACASSRPYKASLNYDQISAKDADLLAQECRGLVLATLDGSPIPMSGPVGSLQVLARPMDRFFNLGQGSAHEVDDEGLAHPDARVWEKVDGTLCIVYCDTIIGEWCVATRSVPDADRLIDGFGDHTFRSLFDEALRQRGMDFADLTSRLAPSATYCFELCSPRAGSGVVQYESESLHLLAVRMTATGEEFCPSDLSAILPVVASYPASSVEALRSMIEARSPAEAEGVVLRLAGRTATGGYRRVKVKSTAYVAAHGLSSAVGASPRNLLRIILKGMWDDMAPMCKAHLRERGDALREAFNAWSAKVDGLYIEMRQMYGDDRKAFAVAVQAAGLPIAPLMSLWQGQADCTRGWVESRCKDGDWGDGFLDSLAGYLA